MKQKTSITLSQDLLRELAKHSGSAESRSAYIERVLRRHFRRRERAAAQARDIQRINAAARRLNAEAEDVLEYQAVWPEDE
jgi:metal-responsive CopG/Arc/MetJ family transcriptional regulator